MTPAAFLSLALQTIAAPRDVARLLMSANLSREALLTAFGLVIIASGLVFHVSNLLSPGPVPVMLADPIRFVILQAVVQGATIAALTGMGRIMGGTARLSDIAVLMIWLNAIRVVVLVLLSVLMMVSGLLSMLVIFAMTALGFWITLNFIDEAHGFENLFKAFGTLVLGLLAMAFALSFLLTLAGVSPEGMLPDV